MTTSKLVVMTSCLNCKIQYSKLLCTLKTRFFDEFQGKKASNPDGLRVFLTQKGAKNMFLRQCLLIEEWLSHGIFSGTNINTLTDMPSIFPSYVTEGFVLIKIILVAKLVKPAIGEIRTCVQYAHIHLSFLRLFSIIQ